MKKITFALATVAYGYKYGGGTIAGAHEITSLAEGAIAFIEENGSLIDAAAPAPTTQFFRIARGNANATNTTANPDLSNLINRSNLEIAYQAYVAPVAKTMFLGSNNGVSPGTADLNIPATVYPGSYTVALTFLDVDVNNPARTKRWTYEALVASTAASVMAGLVTMINLDTATTGITATGITYVPGATYYGIQLSGTAGVNFTAKGENDLELADVVEYKVLNGTYTGTAYTNTVDITYGEGTATQLTEIERVYSAEEGNIQSDLLGSLLWTKSSQVVAAETYDLFVYTTKQQKNDYAQTNGLPYKEEFVLAVPAGDTVVTNVTTINGVL